MWERPAVPAGGNGVCAGRVMYDGRHEPKYYAEAMIVPQDFTRHTSLANPLHADVRVLITYQVG